MRLIVSDPGLDKSIRVDGKLIPVIIVLRFVHYSG